jgi:hypothetical protein
MVLATPSAVLAQSNFCPLPGFDDSVVWTVDAGTNELCEQSVGCPSGGVCVEDSLGDWQPRCKGVVDLIRMRAGSINPALSESQVLNVLDASLQNWMRTSRARGRVKISSQTAPCTVDGSGSTPCIGFAKSGLVDFVLDEDGNWRPAPALARAMCSGSQCRIMLNIDRWNPNAWVTTDNNTNIALIGHEIAHTVGLNHADLCGAGCTGELACAQDYRSHLLAPGDARGARNALQGTPDLYTHRFIGSGSRALGGVSIATQPFIHPTNNNPIAGTHLGRIDCASYENSYAQCAAVVPYQLNNGTSKMRIVALKGWSETQGWTSAFVVAEFDAENNLAPDIALSPYGNEAYFVQSTTGAPPTPVAGTP